MGLLIAMLSTSQRKPFCREGSGAGMKKEGGTRSRARGLVSARRALTAFLVAGDSIFLWILLSLEISFISPTGFRNF